MKNLKLKPLLVGLMATATFAACSTDGDFDLSNVDMTVGWNGDELSLSGETSTDSITLETILDIDTTGLVTMLPNGDYAIKKEGSVNSFHLKVNKLTFKLGEEEDIRLGVNVPAPTLPSKANVKRDIYTQDIEVEGSIAMFNFDANMVKEVVDLTDVKLKTDEPMKLEIRFSNDLKELLSGEADNTFTFQLPSFIGIDRVEKNGQRIDCNDNLITVGNLTDNTTLDLYVSGFKGIATSKQAESEYLYIDDAARKVYLKGGITMHAKIMAASISYAKALQGGTFEFLGHFAAPENVEVTSATGHYSADTGNNPGRGNVKFENVPNFLSDDNVEINLDNPQIDFTVSSTFPLTTLIDATLTAHGGKLSSDMVINLPQFAIFGDKKSKILICKRTPTGIIEGVDYDKIIEVSNLSDLITKIPDKIDIVANAKADPSTLATVNLDTDYTFEPEYSIYSPLAFAENTVIVYNDTIDGWYDDIVDNLEDVSLGDNTVVTLAANVINNIPANVDIEAFAIDNRGLKMSDSRVSVDITEGSHIPGTLSDNGVTSKLQIVISQKETDAIKSMDGIVFKATLKTGSGTELTGKTLNARKQALILKDISVKLKGKVEYDAN